MTSERDIDGGWAWLVLLASYFNLLLCSGLAYVAGMFQLVFLDQFHGSVAFTSWVTALFSSLMQLAGPLSSMVSNCFNCRVSVMVGGALMSLGLFISSMTDSLEMLFITFGVIAGMGLGLTYTASIVVINYFFVEKRTLVTGIGLSASGLGLVITPQVSQLLFENFTWRESLTILSGAAAQVCVMGALMSSVHEKKMQTPTDRRFCCFGTSGLQDQTVIYEYEARNDTEDEILIQKHHSTSIDENAFISNADKEMSVINMSEERNDATCTDCLNIKEYPLHHDEESTRNLVQSSNHQHTQETNDSTESIPSHVERPGQKSHFVRMKSQSSSSTPILDLREHVKTGQTPKLTASHQELSTNLLLPRIRALRNAETTRSHQELSDHQVKPSHTHTLSNPHLIRRMNLARPGSLEASRTSFELTGIAAGEQSQVVVISRSPSFMGLVPSIAPLEVIISPRNEFQSKSSLHSSNVFESRIFLTKPPPTAKTSKPSGISGDRDVGKNYESGVESRTFPPLYKNTCFWLLCLSLFVGNAGCGIFNIHFPGFIKDKGLTDYEVTNILSINGFALLFGRCLCAALANSVKGNDLIIYWALHVLGGISLCLMPNLGQAFVSLGVLVYGVGSYYGSVYAVLSPITIEIVGLTGLATAFGIEMVFAGLGYFVAPPLAGALVDITNSYDYSMYCGGALFILGGTIIFGIPLLGHTLAPMTHNDVTLGDQGQEVVLDALGSKSCSLEDCGFRKDDIM